MTQLPRAYADIVLSDDYIRYGGLSLRDALWRNVVDTFKAMPGMEGEPELVSFKDQSNEDDRQQRQRRYRVFARGRVTVKAEPA